MKRRSNQTDELHRGPGEIEAEGRKECCKLLPEKYISDLHQHQERKDPKDDAVRDSIDVAVSVGPGSLEFGGGPRRETRA